MSYILDRLILMLPIHSWRNSTPFWLKTIKDEDDQQNEDDFTNENDLNNEESLQNGDI